MSTVLRNWGEILLTQNLSTERTLDPVSRWLLITRASVLPMTVVSGAMGGLLAARSASVEWLYWALAMIGLLLAHVANNMVNDYFDLEAGIDSEEYVRGRYAPHPVLSGLISKRGLILAIATVNVLALGVVLFLSGPRGWPVPLFALLGLFVGVGYVAPPLQLKHRGLGEPAVALVWGPLMIGGTYYVSAGALPSWVLAVSLPYGVLATTVLIGKHIDKLEPDTARGIHTLPVLLGRERALFLNQLLMGLFFLLVLCLVLVGTLGVWSLLVCLALPRFWKVLSVYARAPPSLPPEDYPIWPLWYVAWAFLLTRRAGGLLVLGLLLDALYPLHLSS